MCDLSAGTIGEWMLSEYYIYEGVATACSHLRISGLWHVASTDRASNGIYLVAVATLHLSPALIQLTRDADHDTTHAHRSPQKTTLNTRRTYGTIVECLAARTRHGSLRLRG